jgi:hypothetical protein
MNLKLARSPQLISIRMAVLQLTAKKATEKEAFRSLASLKKKKKKR